MLAIKKGLSAIEEREKWREKMNDGELPMNREMMIAVNSQESSRLLQVY